MECESELKPKEIQILRQIFRFVLKHAKSPTVKELQLSRNRSEEEIIHTLDELEKKDLLLRKKGTQEIVSVYPLSLRPTQHQIILEDGTRLFAMCAVDALGMPAMFNKNAKILSQCEECKREVAFEIRGGEIAFLSHHRATICSPKDRVYPSAETCCPLVNFFCSEKHADEWIDKTSRLRGNVNKVSVKHGFSKIRECWRRYGETLSIRQSEVGPTNG